MHTVSKTTFLKDVLTCSLGAYGGPAAHMGIFIDQMVVKKKYLTEEELVELLALCSILPGPTSTQTIVAIGHKMGGPLLAFLTMLVWAAPVLLVMTGLSFTGAVLTKANISTDVLRFIGPMAVGFILLAAWKIGNKVVNDKMTWGLMIFGAVATYFIRSPWVFPLVLLIGAAIAILLSKEDKLWNRAKISPPWIYLVAFIFFAASSLALAVTTDWHLVKLFESFYRYGYLVFGGGQVVVPVMHAELVGLNQYMTDAEFLTGYGFVQGLPGPMFSFAAYAGGMGARESSILVQTLGGLLSGIAIFLPGLLLIYFIYPVWESIKQIKAVKVSLKGINAVAGGMIVAAALILMQVNGFAPINIAVALLTLGALLTQKIPAPLLVVLSLLAGFFL